MDLWKGEFPIRNDFKDEHRDRCLIELREIRDRIAHQHTGRQDFFEFGVHLKLGAEKPLENKLREFTKACIWHAIALKTEFKFKLLYSIDGYLAAVELKNPVSTILLARYLLELAATVNEIDANLKAARTIPPKKWRLRGFAFLGYLYRARHSTSHPEFKAAFAKLKIPMVLAEPIRIGKAIKELTKKKGFGSAQHFYDALSNLSHHNGSGHKMFAESGRMSRIALTKNGKAHFVDEDTATMTLKYPSTEYESRSLNITARVAWWSAEAANGMIEGLLEEPFTDDELSSLVGKTLTNREVFYGLSATEKMTPQKIGRNDPCLCGSGKKYKLCCIRTRKEPRSFEGKVGKYGG